MGHFVFGFFFFLFFFFDLNLQGASDSVGSLHMGGTATVEDFDAFTCSTEAFLNQTNPPNANIPARLSNPILWNQPSSLGINWNGNITEILGNDKYMVHKEGTRVDEEINGKNLKLQVPNVPID